MNATSIREIAERAGAEVKGVGLGNLEAPVVERVIHDSRLVQAGDVFVALPGERTDGHRFLREARERGAVAALVKKGAEREEVEGLAMLEVEEPLAALQRLASWWRGELGAVVICVGGCSGKTSTKQMLTAILEQEGRVSSTPGNWNNQIGLPLTILSARREEQFAVWELGSNRPGEIRALAQIARPVFSIVTNIGTAHIEFFGNRMGIALEEGSVFSETAKEGACFYPGRDDFADTLEWLAGERARPIYLEAGDPCARDIRTEVDGVRFVLSSRGRGYEVKLRQPGRHIVMDALLAAAAAMQLGVSGEKIAQGLQAAQPEGGRLVVRRMGGVWVWDDSYNANPESVIAALQSMREVELGTGRKFAVLGKMGELGKYAVEGAQRVGAEAARCCDGVICVGDGVETIHESVQRNGLQRVWYVPLPEQAAEILLKEIQKGGLVLVKGSRSARMERVIAVMEKLLTPPPQLST